MATTYEGYMRRILQIDLTTETATEYPFSDQQREKTLGGKILAHHILSKELTGTERPFSEENRQDRLLQLRRQLWTKPQESRF